MCLMILTSFLKRKMQAFLSFMEENAIDHKNVFLHFCELEPIELPAVNHTAPIETHGMLRVILHRVAGGRCITEVVQKLAWRIPEAFPLIREKRGRANENGGHDLNGYKCIK